MTAIIKNPQGFEGISTQSKTCRKSIFKEQKAEGGGLYSLHSCWMRAILFAELRNVHTFIIDSLKFKRL